MKSCIITPTKIEEVKNTYEEVIQRKNNKKTKNNGVYQKWEYPVLTRDHIPYYWKYDLDLRSNPFMMERMGINAVFNAGAIYLNKKYYIIARVEGSDRKSFFAVAESDTGVDEFKFWDYPIRFDEVEEETNIYDMRITQHEDGYIYGVFCSESQDKVGRETGDAIAAAGIVRTKDLKSWERLPNLITPSPQQRNVVLHPEFVEGKYAFYTRPQDSFIDAGKGGGIGYGLCEDIMQPCIAEEIIISPRRYHTITEAKNGAGTVPIKTNKGWIHIAHGVRNTAAGLRYVLYVFATDLHQPHQVIAQPGGYFLVPEGEERVGDVSNVVFSNGAIVDEAGNVYIYYASSDTRLHVATTTIERLVDYTFNTPNDPLTAMRCVEQRSMLIEKNLRILR